MLATFSQRHRDFEELLERHFELVAHHVRPARELSRARRLLIGAYFTHEYSVEAAALFNPSIVLAPDQRRCSPGRAPVRDEPARGRRGAHLVHRVPHRHASTPPATWTFDPPGPLPGGRRSQRTPAWYDKAQFHAKLTELGAGNELA